MTPLGRGRSLAADQIGNPRRWSGIIPADLTLAADRWRRNREHDLDRSIRPVPSVLPAFECTVPN